MPAIQKRGGNAPSSPTVPGGSPDWFQAYGRSNKAVIEYLLARVNELEKRLAAAGIA